MLEKIYRILWKYEIIEQSPKAQFSHEIVDIVHYIRTSTALSVDNGMKTVRIHTQRVPLTDTYVSQCDKDQMI